MLFSMGDVFTASVLFFSFSRGKYIEGTFHTINPPSPFVCVMYNPQRLSTISSNGLLEKLRNFDGHQNKGIIANDLNPEVVGLRSSYVH